MYVSYIEQTENQIDRETQKVNTYTAGQLDIEQFAMRVYQVSNLHSKQTAYLDIAMFVKYQVVKGNEQSIYTRNELDARQISLFMYLLAQ